MGLKQVEQKDVEHVAPTVANPNTWKNFFWDTFDKSPEERWLLFKVDAVLVTFGCLGTFIKYLDRSNLQSAFVSGMKEALDLYGNELNYANTCYAVANIIGLWPFALILSKSQPRYFIPFLEIAWTACTFGQAWMKTPMQMYVLRSLVGLFECAHYSAIAYLCGAWYTKNELSRRLAIINCATAIGPMFSGYLQAAVYKGLNGRHNMEGWQWLFIIDGVISIAVIIPQIILLPDTVARQKPSILLSEADIELARDRMPGEGRIKQGRYTWAQVKTWLLRPDLYGLWLLSVCNSIGNQPANSYAFWLKGWNKSHPGTFSVAQINVIPTAESWMVVLVTLVSAWLSDTVLRGRRWPSLVVCGTINAIICILLGATPLWPKNKAFRHFLYIQAGWLQAANSMFWAWANESFRGDPGGRSFAVSGLNVWAWLCQATVPLQLFQTKHQPDVQTGDYVGAAFCFLSPITALSLWQYQKRYPVPEDRLADAEDDSESADGSELEKKKPLEDEESSARAVAILPHQTKETVR